MALLICIHEILSKIYLIDSVIVAFLFFFWLLKAIEWYLLIVLGQVVHMLVTLSNIRALFGFDENHDVI